MGTSKRSDNLKSFQEQQKADTFKAIDEAILHLREEGHPITKKAIAEEVGIHPNTLGQQHVKEFLENYPEFSKKTSMSLEEENEMLKLRIKSLEDQLAHSRNYNARVIRERDTAREERDEFEFKYRKLLGQYQIEVGKKTNTL